MRFRTNTGFERSQFDQWTSASAEFRDRWKAASFILGPSPRLTTWSQSLVALRLDRRSPPDARRYLRGAAMMMSRSAITPMGMDPGKLSKRPGLVSSTEIGDMSPSFDTTVGITSVGSP